MVSDKGRSSWECARTSARKSTNGMGTSGRASTNKDQYYKELRHLSSYSIVPVGNAIRGLMTVPALKCLHLKDGASGKNSMLCLAAKTSLRTKFRECCR